MRGLVFERDHWLQARAEFEKAEAAAPRNDVLFFNLGLVYRRNGLFEDALAAFARAAAINPRELPSGTHPRAIDKARQVEVDGRAVADLERTFAADAVVSGLVPGSAAHHRAIAELLDRRGADVAARGHRLRALELDAGVRVSSVEAPEGLPRPTSRP
jgi:tetratricopeptide (TPR) repeat protein